MAFKRSPVRSRLAPQVFSDSGNQYGVVASWLLATSARRWALSEGDAPCRPSDLDYPIITTARVHHRVGNNRNCDPQIIERVSDAGGMDSLNTCNPGS